jgi:hsp70-interacting protein
VSSSHCLIIADDSFVVSDFFKIGGFCIILPCLNSEYAEVRSETALLVGELAQNNPFCQEQLLKLDILPKLIDMMTDEAEVSSHAFHAISCIVRSYEPGMEAFISMGGLECLLGLIQSVDREKLIIKSMFLINSFAQDSPAVRDELIKLNAAERIIATLQPKDEYNTRLEQTLAALTSLIVTNDAIKRCQKETLNFREQLNKIVSLGSGKPECDVSCLSHVPI